MSIGFPTNTVVMIIATMVASSIGIWFILSQGLARIPVSQRARRNWRWGAALFLSTWFLARLALAAYPPGDAPLATQFLISFVSLGYGLLVGILLLLISPSFRRMLRAIPERWLVAPHAVRLAGFLFLALMDMRLLPATFALSAGYGDMLVGLLALGLVYLLAKSKPYTRTLVIGWNILGLADFVAAVLTGRLYIIPFAEQLAASGISLDYLNYVLVIPSYGVPLYALLHTFSLFQMFSRRTGESGAHQDNAMQAPVFQGEASSANPRHH